MIRFLSILLLLAFAGLSQGQQQLKPVLKAIKVADDSFVVFQIDASGDYKMIGVYGAVTRPAVKGRQGSRRFVCCFRNRRCRCLPFHRQLQVV